MCLRNLVLFIFDNVELVCSLSSLFLLVVRQSQDSPEAVVRQSRDSRETVARLSQHNRKTVLRQSRDSSENREYFRQLTLFLPFY